MADAVLRTIEKVCNMSFDLWIAAFLLGFAGGYAVRELVSRRRYYRWKENHWYW
jgi:hypothetical protein